PIPLSPAWTRDSRASPPLIVLRWGAILLISLLCGCAGAPKNASLSVRPFLFQQDTFAYANELVWAYRLDPATGKMTHHRRDPPATYSHHCFVLARSARQFFQHARFDPSSAPVDDATYRRLIRKVVSRSPRQTATETEKIVIPGYTNLFAFSHAHEK